MDPDSYAACAPSLSARLMLPRAGGSGVHEPVEGVLFFSPCCVIGCDVTVHNMSIDALSFSTDNPVMAVPVDAPYAVAKEGVIKGVVAGMRVTRGLMPLPGDPAATLALLPTILSINAGLGLSGFLTPQQIMAAYPCFLTPLMTKDVVSAGSIDAAVESLVVRVAVDHTFGSSRRAVRHV
jgi:hypothetical protein